MGLMAMMVLLLAAAAGVGAGFLVAITVRLARREWLVSYPVLRGLVLALLCFLCLLLAAFSCFCVYLMVSIIGAGMDIFGH